jgi:hypothetical protein
MFADLGHFTPLSIKVHITPALSCDSIDFELNRLEALLVRTFYVLGKSKLTLLMSVF